MFQPPLASFVRTASILALGALCACAPGPDDGKDDDSGAVGDGGAGDGGADGAVASDGVSPSILESDVWCYPHADGETTNYFWSATLSYSDPRATPASRTSTPTALSCCRAAAKWRATPSPAATGCASPRGLRPKIWSPAETPRPTRCASPSPTKTAT